MTVANITVSGSVTGGGASSAGGVIGSHVNVVTVTAGTSLAMTNLSNSANVSANSSGGIIGSTNSCGSSSQLVNSGVITSTANAGGIVGYFLSKSCIHPVSMVASTVQVVNCTNSGNVSGNTRAGGIAGMVDSATNANTNIAFCKTTGSVIGQWVGGLVGVANGLIEDSWSSGAVSSTSPLALAGGAFGALSFGSSGRANRVFATGNVTSTAGFGFEKCGSFVGETATAGMITDSFAAGSVSACANSSNRVGLFVGHNSGGATLTNVSYNSNATCTNTSGACTAIGTAVNLGATPNFFNITTNAPLSSWNFSTIWQTGSGNFPVLR